MGTAIRMMSRYFLKRSLIGDTIADEIKPAMMSTPPAIPASVSVKPYGSRIWLTRAEMLLKKPT